MSDSIAETNGRECARRTRLERIRRLRVELDASWSEAAPLPSQAAALELAKDVVPWLLAELERLREENEGLRAQLDSCREQLDARAALTIR